jgi:ubiquinone/menaquinone biosynthesis C-methylase UbiE
MKSNIESGYTTRNVDFSKIHGDHSKAFTSMISKMNIRSGMVIGDLMGGCGGVSREILDYCNKNNLFVKIVLLDAFEEQLKKSQSFLAPYDQIGYCIQRRLEDARMMTLDSMLDSAVIKFGLHEVPQCEQPRIMRGTFKSLKEGGELYIWEIFGQTPNIHKHFRRMIKKKDKISRYNSFVQLRYFPEESKVIEYLSNAGFRDIEVIYSGDFLSSTLHYHKFDFPNNPTALMRWNDYLRKTLPPEAKVEDTGDSINLHILKKIIKARK